MKLFHRQLNLPADSFVVLFVDAAANVDKPMATVDNDRKSMVAVDLGLGICIEKATDPKIQEPDTFPTTLYILYLDFEVES